MLGSIPGWEGPLEKKMAIHSSILTWRIPWTEEPGRLQSIGHKESDATERLTLPLFSSFLKRSRKGEVTVGPQGCTRTHSPSYPPYCDPTSFQEPLAVPCPTQQEHLGKSSWGGGGALGVMRGSVCPITLTPAGAQGLPICIVHAPVY